MKKVIFVRHGKSSWSDYSLSDHQRPLKKRGIREAAIVAQKILSEELCPEAIHSSNAVRAAQTANIFGDTLLIKNRFFSEELYHAGESNILAYLSKLDNSINEVLMFGHNPAYTDLINAFSKKYIANVPTSGAFLVQFKIMDWIEISDFNGSLKKYWFPKMYRNNEKSIQH